MFSMGVQYVAQNGDQPGEKFPPLDAGRIIMIRSPILSFKIVVVALPFDDRGMAFPSQPQSKLG